MKQGECEQCKTLFDRAPTGRPKRFCSDRCRVTFGRRMRRARGDLKVPTPLVEAPRWVRHVNKRPVTPSGTPASVTDPKTWVSLAVAAGTDLGHGLGYVLGEGIGCVDFDDVIDGDGVLAPVVEALLWALPPTWVEVSPSGRGLHVWGLLPEAPGRKFTYKGVSVEVYSRARYITVVGRDPFRGAPMKLADLSDFAAQLEREKH